MDGGDPQAASRLLPLVYDELHRLARARLAHLRPGETVHPTSLVHEAYIQLTLENERSWSNRGHFFGAAASAMRNILVDQARRKASLKRGGHRRPVNSEYLDELPAQPPVDGILALDVALERLAAIDERRAKVVELRFFAGLSLEKIAGALNTSVSSVQRDWRFARSWLQVELRDFRLEED